MNNNFLPISTAFPLYFLPLNFTSQRLPMSTLSGVMMSLGDTIHVVSSQLK